MSHVRLLYMHELCCATYANITIYLYSMSSFTSQITLNKNALSNRFQTAFKLESIRVNFKQCALWSALQTGDEFNISDYFE